MKVLKQTEKEDPVEALVKKQLRLKALAILGKNSIQKNISGLYPELNLVNFDV
jgi:hypothetical protein